MKRIFWLVIIFWIQNCAVLITQSWKPPKERESMEEVRVLLAKVSNTPIRLTTEGLLSIYDVNQLLIKKSIDSIQINPTALKAPIQVQSEKGWIQFEKNPYRGKIQLVPQKNEVYIINLVGLEEYLYSVVPSEVYPDWSEEALKAQAVTARTYVVREMVQKSKELYDVVATTQNQVYQGMQKETPKTTKAVDDTKGTILVYNSSPIQAFFHSNAGGFTERAENVWSSSLPYLDHVESPYDKEAPNYSWEDRIPINEMNQYLKSLGIGNIQDITVIQRNFSQRVELLAISGTLGNKNIKGKEFRSLIGETKLKSLKFGIRKEGESFYIKGLGSGHGVGMSQWGAQGMAKRGKSYIQILSHYYKGTELAKIIYKP